MELYRAIPRSRLAAAKSGFQRQSTVRVPSNVPYIVDNLWESLRPKNMPSRRHAIYANATPELALRNASSPLKEGDEYVACRVIVDAKRIRVAQLQVADAREHEDIRLISRWVSERGHALSELSLDRKQKLAPLFMPGLHRSELTRLCGVDSFVLELREYARERSRFWGDAFSEPQFSGGELFFELISADDTYWLEKVEFVCSE